MVLAAGAKQKAGQSRMDLATDNARMCRHVVPTLMSGSPNALLLVVTNPVDVITKAVLDASGLDPAQVIGTGTVLDSSWLRVLLAERCQVAVQNVHAYVIGEHGDSEVALWSSATSVVRRHPPGWVWFGVLAEVRGQVPTAAFSGITAGAPSRGPASLPSLCA